MSKSALIILDGRGKTDDNATKRSAPYHAKTPYFDGLCAQYPMTYLHASEEAVGLPVGQVGNSEVGHTTLGSGRVIYQDLVKISKALADGSLQQHPLLLDAIQQAKTTNRPIHLMGLLSDGGVHAHSEHIRGLCQIFSLFQVPYVLHGFLDGRDTSPTSGKEFVAQALEFTQQTGGVLGSLVGRYYAMDRDNRRERVKQAYDLLVHGVGTQTSDVLATMQAQYDAEVTDEFMPPLVLPGFQSIQDGDVVLFANYRSDRAREITVALTQRDIPDHGMKKMHLTYLTMTIYDESFQGLHVLFPKDNLSMTLGETLSRAGKTQLRAAETEKYPHVTFFFNGGREEPRDGEARIVAPSPKVATYDLQPEMSAYPLTEQVIAHLRQHQPDFLCLNYANPDMVGHTGVREAVLKACETVDDCLSQLVPVLQELGYETLIIADHGNADQMAQDDGSPHTAHTLALVPCVWVRKGKGERVEDGVFSVKEGGGLADIAPTILAMMGVDQPSEMTGKVLVR